MSYSIYISSAAKRDLCRAADYMEYTLKNPQAADHLLDETERKISALSQFPKQHPLVSDKILAAWGIRFVQIGNYLAFYTVTEEKKQVNIVRFLYAKSDWISLLRFETPFMEN